MRTLDKIRFVIGVIGLQMSMYLLGSSPRYWLIFWNFAMTVPLLTIKFIYYKSLNWHYYFLDFCYFGNTFLYVFAFLWPGSRVMFISAFAYATGIMASGIVQFRNSLVFHDIDRLSSMLIHVVPLKFMWKLRWYGHDDTSWGFFNPETAEVGFMEYYTTPIYFFTLHFVIYCLIVFGIS